MTDKAFVRKGGRFVARKYALSRKEAERVLACPRAEEQLETWRAKHGFSMSADSPLARGKLLDLVRGCLK